MKTQVGDFSYAHRGAKLGLDKAGGALKTLYSLFYIFSANVGNINVGKRKVF